MGKTKTNPYSKEDEELIKSLKDLRSAGFLTKEEYKQRVAVIRLKYDSVQAKDDQAKQQREEAHLIFKRFDTDGSGSIDLKELQSLIFSLGETMSSSEVAKLKQALDKDNDGEISFDEFFEWWSAPSRAHGSADAQTFLKMKLQSTQYMKSLKSSAKAIKAKEKAKAKWNVDVDVQVGTVKTTDLGFKVTAGMDHEADLSGVGVTLVFGLNDGFDQKYITDGQVSFKRLLNLAVNTGLELPFKPDVKFSQIEVGGKQCLQAHVGIPSEIVPEEVTGMAGAMLDGVLGSIEFGFDQKELGLKWKVHLEAPKSVKDVASEIAEEAAGEDAQAVKDMLSLIGLFHSTKLRIKYRKLEDSLLNSYKAKAPEELHPIFDFVVKGDNSLVGGVLEKLAEQPIAISQAVSDFVSNFTFLKSITANLGSFKVHCETHLEGGVQRFVKPSDLKFDKTRILDQSNYEGPATVKVSFLEPELKLEDDPYLKFFYICNWCHEFGKGKVYRSEGCTDFEDEIKAFNNGYALHPLCYQEIADASLHKTCACHEHPLVHVKSLDIIERSDSDWKCCGPCDGSNLVNAWKCFDKDCEDKIFCQDCLEKKKEEEEASKKSSFEDSSVETPSSAAPAASAASDSCGCTFVTNGKKFVNQKWYRCYDCFKTAGVGCCVSCLETCHKGHKTKEQEAASFYCDCGAGAGPVCAQTKKGKAKKKPINTSSASTDETETESDTETETATDTCSFSYSGSD